MGRRPVPNQHENTRVLRIPLSTHAKIDALARQERRTKSAQIDLIVDEWLAFKGYAVDDSGIPDRRPLSVREGGRTVAPIPFAQPEAKR